MILPIYTKYYRIDKPPVFKKHIKYSKNGFIEKTVYKFKDKEFEVSSNYIGSDLLCTLIYVKQAGEWLKSKLKYYKDGKVYKTLTSDKNDKTVWSNK